jgi:3-dehydroquinate dehydratase-2
LAKKRHNILILIGPNLNMLGVREPDMYGFQTLAQIEAECAAYGEELGFGVELRQSNHEGELVTLIQEAREEASGLIINAAAYSHTSIAIHDALKLLDAPIIEVHGTNIHKREAFRHHSYVSSVAHGTICGFGGHGYILALDAMRALLDEEK